MDVDELKRTKIDVKMSIFFANFVTFIYVVPS